MAGATHGVSTRLATVSFGLLLAAIAWGAFAFGAVRPWAFWPLAITAQIIGLIGLLLPSAQPAVGLGRLSAAFGLFIGVSTLQLVPLSLERVAALSPHA